MGTLIVGTGALACLFAAQLEKSGNDITMLGSWPEGVSGAQGIPSYTLVGEDAAKDEAKAKAAIEGSGAAAVVVMRPVAKDKEIRSTPSMYMGPMYGPYWGGYYGYGWGAAWAPAPDIRTDTIVTVETLVYSLKQNKLVWAGESQTTNPSKVDAFVRELAAGAGKEMKKLGLL